jgi:hypothetical protein
VAKSERLVFVANYRVMLLDVPLKLFEWSIWMPLQKFECY